ncbi:MAG: hypothetical protein IKA87_02725 [Lentisphaeria bacterium]|nr:hypothetical protein [Lentisphaeria bacterium]
MKKVCYIRMFAPANANYGPDDSGTSYGYKLTHHNVLVRKMLEKQGFEFFSCDELPPEKADIVFCFDLSADVRERIKLLPRRIKRVLQCYETAVYAPLCHSVELLSSDEWDAVITWNRAYEADHIFHYDIPLPGKSTLGSVPDNTWHDVGINSKGVTVASYKDGDHRGFAPARDVFYRKTAEAGFIDLYGKNWKIDPRKNIIGPTENKIVTISQYPYSLIIENMLANGYVTEKLADSILAGVPAIYLGDFHNAARRFPGTFVPLKSIGRESFIKALQQLSSDYDILRANVLKCRECSDTWGDSYIAAMQKVFDKITAQ